MKHFATGYSLALALCSLSLAHAGDWNQWRGPRHDGISDETAFQTQWPAGKPAEAWHKEIGRGYGAVAVAQGRVYVMGNKDGQDTVACLDATTGSNLWSISYNAPQKLPGEYGSFYGPHATPTVEDGKVYVLSRDGQARCLASVDGKEVWFTDLKTLDAKPPTWGMAGSPLIVNDLVILNAGASGIALDKATGKPRWSSTGIGGYATPVPFSPDGKTHALAVFSKDSLIAVRPADGTRLWALPWKTDYDVNAADPCVDGDALFITTGYGRGCARVKASDGSIVWQNKELSTQCAGGVLYKGSVYGFNGKINEKGQLRCIDAATGTVRWSQPNMMGSLKVAGDKLIIALTAGDLVIVEANPDAYREVARAPKVASSECWTMPVLANGRIYLRTYGGMLHCLDVTEPGKSALAKPETK
jgi:outer membrane protein assembly factor BamB